MRNLNLLVILMLLAILSSFQNRVLAQSSPIDTKLAAQYFQEANALCNRDNGKLWGVSLCAPVLLVDRKTRAVVANQADKKGIFAKSGDVFVGQLPAKVNVANTATEWSGVKWTMVIFPLPEDKIRRANLLAHELWHRVQDDIGFPASGAANNHLDSRDGRVWLQLEWRALAAALVNRGKQRRQAIADALLFRAYRRAIFPNAAAEEREMEMHEGLAEYTGVKLSGSPDLNQYVVDKDLKEAANRQTSCARLLTPQFRLTAFCWMRPEKIGVKVWKKRMTLERCCKGGLPSNRPKTLNRRLRDARGTMMETGFKHPRRSVKTSFRRFLQIIALD